MINNLKESSPGWDAISPISLKHILPSILKPVVRILNISLEEGVFPDEMKIARVLPLYKSADPMIANHYRPVSIYLHFPNYLSKQCTQDYLIFLWNINSWWRHQMETVSALLAIWAGNSPVPGEFSAQRPVTRGFDVFFDLRPDKQLTKQSWGWWFESPSHSLWRHRYVYMNTNLGSAITIQYTCHWLFWSTKS